MARKIVVLLGPPGSGKGTQAKLVASYCGLPHISTGDMLRTAVTEGSDLGLRVRSIMEAGALVSDDIMRDVVKSRIEKLDCRYGLVLDGFPRTMQQVQDLDSILADDSKRLGVIQIQVSQDTIRKRLVGRRSCLSCGKVFNVYESPSSSGMLCDACGAPVVQRRDDSEEVVNERLRVYTQQTEPLVVYYKKLGLLHNLDGEREVEAVHKDIVDILKRL